MNEILEKFNSKLQSYGFSNDQILTVLVCKELLEKTIKEIGQRK